MKYRRELKNLLRNLQLYLDALNAGAAPGQIQRGFIHPEPHGVLAIDQHGEGKGLKEFRLYIYPDSAQQKLYLLALGDKNSQRSDIQLCTQWVRERVTAEQTKKTEVVTGDNGNPEKGGDADDEQGQEHRVQHCD